MFKRILIKASGEMLGGASGSGLEQESLLSLANTLAKAHQTGVELGVVIGAGNIIRGLSCDYLSRTKADSAGMLGTSINSLILQDILQKQLQIPSIVLGAFEIEGMFDKASPLLIEDSFAQKKIIIFAGGTGSPFFTTDTAGVLKALEINADLMIKATKVDGIYDKDPQKYPDANKYNQITYQEVLAKRLQIMDLTATSLAMENKLPINVTQLSGDNIINIINKKAVGTLVCV